MKTRAILIDPELAFRRLLVYHLAREAVWVDAVGESSLGAEAVPLCQNHAADFLLLAPPLPDGAPVEFVGAMRRALPAVRILVLGRAPTLGILEAMEAGAHGCAFKTEPLPPLLQAIESVAGGDRYRSPQAQLLEQMEPAGLTARQREVLASIASGLSTKQVAARLQVSYKTADHHRTRLMKKLKMHDLASLVRFAIRHDLVPS